MELFPITFQRAEDVIEFDERCVVPRHKDGRKKIHTESWTLGRYLRALAAAGCLAYPLTATYAKESESPDFLLSMPNDVRIGLEITEASTPQAHHLYIEGERCEGRAVSDGGDPAVSDILEREWADKVYERICTKADGLLSGRWSKAHCYDLVLYDNGATRVGVDLPEALSKLRTLLGRQPHTGFRTVSIIADSSTRLVYLKGDDRVLSIPTKRN